MQFPRAADVQVKQYPATVHQMVIIAELGKNSPDERGDSKGNRMPERDIFLRDHTLGKIGPALSSEKGG